MNRTTSPLKDEVRRLPLAEKLERVEQIRPGYMQAVEGLATMRLEEHFRALDETTKALGKTRPTTGDSR